MEVDFLCSDLKLVAELDGDQHLANPETYRCDRRKDAYLQENGFFILRCLASDLGKHLDHVLDEDSGQADKINFRAKHEAASLTV